MTDPLTAAVLKIAETLAPELVKSGAQKLESQILGTPAERGMQDVYTRAIAGLLVEVTRTSGEQADSEAMKVAENVLEGLCSDEEAAGLLLDVALQPEPVPVEGLRGRATVLGYDPGTLAFDFDEAMQMLAEKVWEEFLAEARKDNSRIQPVINEELLASLRGLHYGTTYGGATRDYSGIAPSSTDPEELEGARRRLEELPVDEIPDRETLPLRSVMPLRPNPYFVGRRKDLKGMAADLKAGGATAVGEVTVMASSGLGGVGKTQLACEFVHRYGSYFHNVYWLNFGDPGSVPAEVASCGGIGGMNLRPDFHDLPMDDRVKAVMAEFQSELPRLLVFDNCDDEELLNQWLPSTGGSRVLITSRRESWDPSLGVTGRALDVLGRRESVELLRKYHPELPEDDPGLHAIAEELGDLPLALDLAGRYLSRYRREVTTADYLAELRKPELLEHPSLRRARGTSPTQHDMDVWRTFAVSYWRLDAADETDETAIRLLACAARLAPGEPIPGDLLAWTLEPVDREGGPPQPTITVRESLDRLTELGLLESTEGETFKMHRLVAAFVSAEISDDVAQTATETACARAAMWASREGQPARWEALLPHVRLAAETSTQREDALTENCCTALSMTLLHLGAYDEAMPYAERALDLCHRLHGPKDRLTLQRRSNVALLHKEMGELGAAKAMYKEILKAQERYLGTKDPDVAATLNNLAIALRFEDLYHEMLPLYERALHIRQRSWKKTKRDDLDRREHAYRVSESYANMGALLMDLGRYREAVPHLDNAFSISLDELGENQERNANTLLKYGEAMRTQGEYQLAIASIGSAVNMYDEISDALPPAAVRVFTALGAVLKEQAAEDSTLSALDRTQTLHQANGSLQAALNGAEQTYEADDPVKGGILSILADVCDAQGAAADGPRYRKQAEAYRRNNIQDEDEEAASGLSMQGTSLVDHGLYEEALIYLERSLRICEGTLSQQDFNSSQILFKLGVLHQLRGSDSQARPYLERALTLRAEICGKNHSATKMVKDNLNLLQD